ncbi:MAG: hypothetical protein QW530_02150 [Candidatus Micrarchaeaceae archaeon]
MKSNRIAISIIVVVILVLAVYIIASAHKVPQTKTTSTALSTSTSIPITTIAAKNYMTPPAQSIGNFSFVSAAPFPRLASIPLFSNGYIEGVSFMYNYSESFLLLRFLVYSNLSRTLGAYRYITNYTVNSTTVLLTSLPEGYLGAEVLQDNNTIYSVSVQHNNTVITATLVQPSATAYQKDFAVGMLVNATKLLFNQSEAA